MAMTCSLLSRFRLIYSPFSRAISHHRTFAVRPSPILQIRPFVSLNESSRFMVDSRLISKDRCFSTRSTTSSIQDPSPNWSNRPPKETILLDGCDFEHWLVVVEKPDEKLTRDEIIDSYIKTLAQVVGTDEEARMKIYSVSTKHYFAFGALVSEELSYKIKALPGVRWVLPDSYLDVKNKDYGGEPFIDGQAVPYDPKYHEEWVRNNARATERSRRQDRPRNYDRSRNFERRRENMQSREYQPRDAPPMPNFQNAAPPSPPGPNAFPPNPQFPNAPPPNQQFPNQGPPRPPPAGNQGYQPGPPPSYQPSPPGGQGYQPGPPGGQGYQPGPPGGQGYQPGPPGGQGYQPGPPGGQGYQPGPPGGQGYQPGPPGSQGYQPGPTGGPGYQGGSPGNYQPSPGGGGGHGYQPGPPGNQGYQPGPQGGQGHQSGPPGGGVQGYPAGPPRSSPPMYPSGQPSSSSAPYYGAPPGGGGAPSSPQGNFGPTNYTNGGASDQRGGGGYGFQGGQPGSSTNQGGNHPATDTAGGRDIPGRDA